MVPPRPMGRTWKKDRGWGSYPRRNIHCYERTNFVERALRRQLLQVPLPVAGVARFRGSSYSRASLAPRGGARGRLEGRGYGKGRKKCQHDVITEVCRAGENESWGPVRS